MFEASIQKNPCPWIMAVESIYVVMDGNIYDQKASNNNYYKA